MPRPLPEAAPILFRPLLVLAALALPPAQRAAPHAVVGADSAGGRGVVAGTSTRQDTRQGRAADAGRRGRRAQSARAQAAQRARDSAAAQAAADSAAADSAARDSAAAADSAAREAERIAQADSAAFVDPVSIGADVQTPAARAGAYLALSVGPIIAEELAPLGAGAAASQGEIALWPAVVVMTLGGWLATGLLYALGRWRGAWIRRRFPRAEATVEKLLGAVQRRPWRSALAVRYAFGLRLLLPTACGAAHVRPDVYFIGSLISSATWSAVFALLGYWFGQAAIAVLHRIQAYDEYAVAVVVALVVVGWLVWRWRQRRRMDAAAASRARQ